MPDIELEEDLKLAPPTERLVEDFGRPLEVVDDEEFDDESLPDPSQQFTLRDMMLITFMAAVGFAVLRLSPPAAFAGVMGGIAILGLALLSIVKPQKVVFHLAWWTVLGVYIIASVIAVMNR